MDHPADESIAAPDALTFQVEWTEAKIASFMRGYMLRQSWVVAFAVLLIAAGLNVLSYSADDAPQWKRFAFAPIIGFAGAVLVYVWLGHNAGKRLWATTFAMRYPLTYSFTDTELRITGKGVFLTTELATLCAASESSSAILIYPSHAVFYIFPKESIGGPDAIARLRAILRAGLPATARVSLKE